MSTPAMCDNWINNAFVAPLTGEYVDVTSPHDNAVIAKCALSGAADVEAAVVAAEAAFETWGAMTLKARAGILMKFHQLLVDRADEIAAVVSLGASVLRCSASCSAPEPPPCCCPADGTNDGRARQERAGGEAVASEGQ